MDICTAVKISNGTGYFEDAGVGAGRKTEAISNQFKHAVAGGIQFTIFLDETRRHLGVAVDFGAFVTLQLKLTRLLHPFGYGGGALGFASISQVAVFYGGNFDVDVDPVQQRAGDTRTVAMNGNRGAGAGVGRIRKVPTGTGVC